MKKFDLEKSLTTGTAIFLFTFGLATCNAEDFCIGFIAGTTTLFAIATWNSDNK